MAKLYLHGDYRKVLHSTVACTDIALISPERARFGLGLGAPRTDNAVCAPYGEALMLGSTAAFLPATAPDKALTSTEPFCSGYFVSWDAEDFTAYYSAPGRGWEFPVILDQVFVELIRGHRRTGLYGFAMAGSALHFDVQALITEPLIVNKPANGEPINSTSNYPLFLRRESCKFDGAHFFAAGVFFKPAYLGISRGSSHLDRGFGSIPTPDALIYHSHAVILTHATTLDLRTIENPTGIAHSFSQHTDSIASVEHILPNTAVLEAKIFVTELSEIIA